MTSSQPTADVSVRTAWSADAPALAAVQVRAWRESYADLLPADVLDQLDADAIAARWQQSIDKPGDARNRVLVALERATVRGLAVTGASADPDADSVADGELVELLVDPPTRGAGHGSRLLQASADTLRADGFTHARVWVASTDDRLREFLTGAGWAVDGAHRELDLHDDGTVRVKQVRLHTDLGSDDLGSDLGGDG
ncbi:MAG: GNAT family N-acetyltransferase [Nocardioidaceae bacterium]|nr:GNAT family N-acetyltransferase [Nocardioidaceae bacterium]